MLDIFVDENEYSSILNQYFDIQELNELVESFKIPAKDLELDNESKGEIVSALVIYFSRHSRLNELGLAIHKLKPNAFYQDRDLNIIVRSSEYSKWIAKTYDSARDLLAIESSVIDAQEKQSRLCKLIEDATFDLPEQKRIQLMNLVKSECGGCNTVWGIIEGAVNTATEKLEHFIQLNCTSSECISYGRFLDENRGKLEERKRHINLISPNGNTKNTNSPQATKQASLKLAKENPPESIPKAILAVVWGTNNPVLRIIILLLIAIIFTLFTLWTSLPDTTKSTVINWLTGQPIP